MIGFAASKVSPSKRNWRLSLVRRVPMRQESRHDLRGVGQFWRALSEIPLKPNGLGSAVLSDDRFLEAEFLLHVGVTEREQRFADLVVGMVEIGALVEVRDSLHGVPVAGSNNRQ